MRRPFWRSALMPGGLLGPGLAHSRLSAASLGSFCRSSALIVTATAPGLLPGVAPALLMAATAAAVAAPRGGSGAAAGTRSGGAEDASWAGADAGVCAAAPAALGVSAAGGERTAEATGHADCERVHAAEGLGGAWPRHLPFVLLGLTPLAYTCKCSQTCAHHQHCHAVMPCKEVCGCQLACMTWSWQPVLPNALLQQHEGREVRR